MREAEPEPRWWVALALFVVCAMWVVGDGIGGPVLATVLGLPLVLVIPGYALTAVVWPGRGPGLAERAVVALGSSLALAAVSALALNWLPGGVSGVRQTILLGLVALAGICAAWARGRPAGDDRTPPWRLHTGARIRPGQVAMLAVAVGLVVGAVGAAGTADDSGPGFTQAWMVPRSAGAREVSIGLQNDEKEEWTYDLQLTAGDRPVREWRQVRLAPGQRWSTTATLPSSTGQSLARLLVFREDAPDRVYRQLAVAIPGSGP